MTATDWTARCQALEAQLTGMARTHADNGLPITAAAMQRAALALQTQRNLLAAANARIAELEALAASIPPELRAGVAEPGGGFAMTGEQLEALMRAVVPAEPCGYCGCESEATGHTKLVVMLANFHHDHDGTWASIHEWAAKIEELVGV